MTRAETGAECGEQRCLVEYAFIAAETLGTRAPCGDVQAAHEVAQRGGMAVEPYSLAVEREGVARWVGRTA